MKTKILTLFLLLVLLTTTGAACNKSDPKAEQALLKPVELVIWGVFDSSDTFNNIIAGYRLTHPNVKIKYYKFRWEEYEKRLLDGWAEQTGPDIFMIHNTWTGKYQNKILPLPSKLIIPIAETSGGGFNNKKKASIKEFVTPAPHQLKDLFPNVVYEDVIKDEQIYGLPLSIDTLALFYNRAHFNAAGITQAPSTWKELEEIIPQLTRQSETNSEILQSAIAMGAADNINRSNDILSLLMLQNGTQMINSRGQVSFHKVSDYERGVYPGEHALDFYTSFANPGRATYTWSLDSSESFEAFSAGKLSMMFGYPYQQPVIQAQAPKIDLGIAPVLHTSSDGTDAFELPINWASYWNYSVFKQTAYPSYAWDFITFMTTQQYKDVNGKDKYYAENYLDLTGKPPALKGLINKFKETYPEQAIFADQLLTATSWYHGKNPDNMNQIFKDMINNVVKGKVDKIKDAVRDAAQAIQKTY